MVEIFGTNQGSTLSKPFRVDVGKVVVISSFNFSCEATDEYGTVIRDGDCAILHKIDLQNEELVSGNGCVSCNTCLLEDFDVSVANSEPVVICGDLWTHNAFNNLSILTIPGYYMFQVCNPSAVGSVSIRIEELTLDQAVLLPKNLIHGE